jgi:predicted small lipoprotein YifL
MALLLCVGLAVLVAGCGQRGPLYLPDEEPAGQEAQTQASPEDEQEENDEENS